MDNIRARAFWMHTGWPKNIGRYQIIKNRIEASQLNYISLSN